MRHPNWCASPLWARPSTGLHEIDSDHSVHAASGKGIVPRIVQTNAFWGLASACTLYTYPLAASCVHHTIRGGGRCSRILMYLSASKPRHTVGLVLNLVQPQSFRCVFRTLAFVTEDESWSPRHEATLQLESLTSGSGCTTTFLLLCRGGNVVFHANVDNFVSKPDAVSGIHHNERVFLFLHRRCMCSRGVPYLKPN